MRGRQPDAIVVGGGVIGCSVAYSLAREKLSVLLLERDQVASHASGGSPALLAIPELARAEPPTAEVTIEGGAGQPHWFESPALDALYDTSLTVLGGQKRALRIPGGVARLIG